ncbi:MHYT domain-containing protein [Streptomyces tauricus]|uniref:MHYT domain-containing protein n=1 Tax=Streptomyces tauricus TaxID=68274 RepID=UPI0033C66637
MPFIAMLGFPVAGTQIRCGVPYTLLRLLTAVVIVAVGLFIVGFRSTGTAPLLLGGTVTGLAVAAMCYLGRDSIGHATGTIVLSIMIAVVAATTTLWAALRITNARDTSGTPPANSLFAPRQRRG